LLIREQNIAGELIISTVGRVAEALGKIHGEKPPFAQLKAKVGDVMQWYGYQFPTFGDSATDRHHRQ
jgi:hypothetical protein